MIIIKSKREIDLMRESGKVTKEILNTLPDFIKPGKTTADIDKYVADIMRKHNVTASFKGYNGFPGSVCASVNEEIVHGIPSKKRILHEGDIVSIDVGCTYKGYITDAARTYKVGKVSDMAEKIIASAEKSFFKGLEFCKVGFRISDISNAIQNSVEADGFGIIRELVGHGVGVELHEEPPIANYGKAGRGPRIEVGMGLAVEPMISEGDYHIDILDDDWTYVTRDRKLSAHYENTIVITDDGEPELLTY